SVPVDILSYLIPVLSVYFFFFSSRRRHTRLVSDWSSDVCSSDLSVEAVARDDVAAARNVISGNGLDGIDILDIGCDNNVVQGNRSEERRVGKECRSRWGA